MHIRPNNLSEKLFPDLHQLRGEHLLYSGGCYATTGSYGLQICSIENQIAIGGKVYCSKCNQKKEAPSTESAQRQRPTIVMYAMERAQAARLQVISYFKEAAIRWLVSLGISFVQKFLGQHVLSAETGTEFTKVNALHVQ